LAELLGIKKMVAAGVAAAHFTPCNQNPLSPRAMPPIYAIAERERPLFCPSAVGGSVYSGWVGKCYESFTLNDLSFAWSLRTFAPVMTGRKPTSRTATAGVFRLPARAQTTIFAFPPSSAQNLLFLTPTSAN
jgi:hypothetical protein